MRRHGFLFCFCFCTILALIAGTDVSQEEHLASKASKVHIPANLHGTRGGNISGHAF